MQISSRLLLGFCFLLLTTSGCGYMKWSQTESGEPQPLTLPDPTETPEPSSGPVPSSSPQASISPTPSVNPSPSISPSPSVSPSPNASPVASPAASPSPSPTPSPTPVVNNPCGINSVVTLANGPEALLAAGDTDFRVQGNITVNSRANDALTINGDGNIYAGKYTIGGNVALDGDGRLLSLNGAAGDVTVQSPPVGDPLARLVAPNGNGIAIRSNSTVRVTGGAPILLPGVYTGGIQISGGTVTFSPGLYYLNGGGLQITGGIVRGANVTFYYNGSSDGGPLDIFGVLDPTPNAPEGVQITNNSIVDISAPTTGVYQGILFSQLRTVNSDIQIRGSGTSRILGAIYAPQSDVEISGAGDPALGSLIISGTLTTTGAGRINLNWGGMPTALCIP